MDFLDIFMVALITIYIVDLSGFTESWRAGLAGLLKIKNLKSLKPFDCGQCMTWWICNIYAVIMHNWDLNKVAFIALLAFLSYPIGQILIFIREALLNLINKMMESCQRKKL